MTNPVGHPDWQSYSQWRGPIFANQSIHVAANTTTELGIFAISHFASMLMFVRNIVGGGIIAFTFSTDGATFVPGYGPSWRTRAGAAMLVGVPAIDNFVKVTISAPVAGTFDGDVTLVPSNTPLARNQYQGSGDLLSASGRSVAAGGNNIDPLPAIVEGPSYIRFDPLGVAGKLSVVIYAIKEDGTVQYIVWRRDNVAAAVEGNFIAPNQPLQVQVVNADVVAHNYDMFVICGTGN